MTGLLQGIASTAASIRRNATNGAGEEPSTRLQSFLTSAVTYPYLHLAATTSILKQHGAGEAGAAANGQPMLPVSTGQQGGNVAAAANKLLRRTSRGPQHGVSVMGYPAGASITVFPEGKAMALLEKWCQEPALMNWKLEMAMRLREYVHSMRFYLQGNPWGTAHGQQAAGTGQQGAYTATQQWAMKLLQVVVQAMDLYIGPSPPEYTIPDIVAVQHAVLVEGNSAGVPTALARISSAAPGADPVTKVASAVVPNVRFVEQELQRRHSMQRSRTWMEIMDSLLGIVRIWFSMLSYMCYTFATFLRIVGNGLSALGGLLAFTVVLSITVSVIASLIFLMASAADATGTFIEYMARFTYLAQRPTKKKPGVGFSKLGPRKIEGKTVEELEDFFLRQLTNPPRLTGTGAAGLPLRAPLTSLRTRPDAPRIAHDPLVVRCYDLQIVDSSGNLLPGVTPEDVTYRYDSAGFFGFASAATRKASAVLLMRLLAWKRITSIMSPPAVLAGAPELEQALRYVYIMGVQGSRPDHVFDALVGLPYSGEDQEAAVPKYQMRPILRHRHAFALLAPPAVYVHTTGPLSWISNVSHGVVSSLVFVVSGSTHPDELLGTEQQLLAAEQDLDTAAPTPTKPSALDAVWQVVALRRPVLLAIKTMSGTPGNESLTSLWSSRMGEEATRRGLEPEHVTVALVDLAAKAPLGPGVAGLPQLQDWLNQALGSAPQQR